MYHANATVDALMKRGYLYLEDHEWKSAKGYFDDALDVDPENAQAYIGMLLAEMHIERECDLHTAEQSFVENYYYKKALRFADDDYQVKLQQYHLDNIYYQANRLFEAAKSEDEYKSAAALFAAIRDHSDAAERESNCLEHSEKARLESLYASAKSLLNSTVATDVRQAKHILESIQEHKDSAELLAKCDGIIDTLEKQNAQDKKKKMGLIAVCAIIAVAIISLILGSTISANNKRADIIYQNFLGKTFDGEMEDDDGFAYAYMNNSLNECMTYWKNTEERSLTFEEDGSVYYTSLYDMTVLAYPSSISKPEGFHNEYDGTYKSFKVRVTLGGEVYVDIGSSSYRVTVNENNVPTKIHDYYGITLK